MKSWSGRQAPSFDSTELQIRNADRQLVGNRNEVKDAKPRGVRLPRRPERFCIFPDSPA
jgi:hypothetical protein